MTTKTFTNSDAVIFSSNKKWEELIDDKVFVNVLLSDVLEKYIQKQRWFAGKSSQLKYIELSEYFKIQQDGEIYFGLLLEVNFKEAFYHHYFIPIAFTSDASITPESKILSISLNNQKGFIVDAIYLASFRKVVYDRISTALPVDKTPVQYHKTESFNFPLYESSKFIGVEQSNTSIIYNDAFILKFFRRIYADKNPDYEMSRFLSDKTAFKNTPPYLGSINIIDSDNINITIGLMQKLVPNNGDAWEYFLKEIHKIFLNIDLKKISLKDLPDVEMFERLKIEEISPQIIDWVGLHLLNKVKLLAKRTAEMHAALGSEFAETSFTPTRFNGDYSVWLKNRLTYQFQNRLSLAENNLHTLEGYSLQLAKEFLEQKNEIRKRLVNFDWTKFKGERIRIHGDYHLGQILVQDDDFCILDFEGEPESSIRDRKVKQPPLKDVAGLFRSFHYAIYATIFNHQKEYEKNQEAVFDYGELLYKYMIAVFMETYVETTKNANLHIGYRNERIFLLKYCLLEKAIYELGYELNSRPKWTIIPLKGIANIMNS
ncbi:MULTISPECIES: trehalose synthase [unclassified Polaribacter]|uniref:trehalose synthase n=1 Tax=unclassified Polaribacter TaxID=196858 RepID=UPI0011BF2A74|nr:MULTISPECIES: trehalose synthase [unclassified Polaribacter]TXD53974.1 trehalose synthase [Polaribacter sp. IC063]TXD59683.1 trehalose synthase [Polaribacter sp. IC066]